MELGGLQNSSAEGVASYVPLSVFSGLSSERVNKFKKRKNGLRYPPVCAIWPRTALGTPQNDSTK